MVALTVALTCCAALPTHNNEPKTCRERAAFKLAQIYPDPAKLDAALATICPVTGGP